MSVVRVTGGRGGKGGYTGAPVTFATQTQVMFLLPRPSHPDNLVLTTELKT